MNAQEPHTLPQFFIAGAPKCGTTSLYRYLQAHPRVFMPEAKEPHFFSPPSAEYHRICESFEAYQRLFADAPPHALIGEASTSYFTGDGTASQVHAVCPQAKIIIMLRKPVDFVLSWHAERRVNRRAREGLWDEMQHGTNYVAEVEKWPSALAEWRRVFGVQNVLVVILEDMAAAPKAEFERVLDFLGLEKGICQPDFKVHNPAKQARAGWLAWLMESRLAGLAKRILAKCPACYAKVHGWLAPKPAEVQQPQGHEMLEKKLRPLMRQLAAILGTNRWN